LLMKLSSNVRKCVNFAADKLFALFRLGTAPSSNRLCRNRGQRYLGVDLAKRNSYTAQVPHIESTLRDLFERLPDGQHFRRLNREAFTSRAAKFLGTFTNNHFLVGRHVNGSLLLMMSNFCIEAQVEGIRNKEVF
jgi:hypothetical protein